MLTLLGWLAFDNDERDPWGEHPVLGWHMEPPVESSLDAFLEHAVPFIEERGWAVEMQLYEASARWDRSARVFSDAEKLRPRPATGPRTTHPATLLCRALLKAAEAHDGV